MFSEMYTAYGMQIQLRKTTTIANRPKFHHTSPDIYGTAPGGSLQSQV